MDSLTILHFLTESAYLIIVFTVFLTMAIIRGRQTVINHIAGLYLAVLITSQFPYYDALLSSLSKASMIAVAKLVIFILVTIACTKLFERIMPEEYREGRFESFGKKIMLSLGATILVMIFSFNVLPVTELLTPGTPIQSLFAPEQYYFWWLILPLIFLYLN
jgi:hypothetical protein